MQSLALIAVAKAAGVFWRRMLILGWGALVPPRRMVRLRLRLRGDLLLHRANRRLPIGSEPKPMAIDHSIARA
jgi:hypothetical protein